jgi:hypothetical protein
MTKFEQLVLRAHHAQLQMLRVINNSADIPCNILAHDLEIDIEYELVHSATDERDETHG